MGFFGILLLIIFIISALLLILLVLIQDDQGEGIGGMFGGGASTSFGSRSGNILTKLTSIVGAVFLICSFALAWINTTNVGGDVIGESRRASATTETQWWQDTPSEEEAPQSDEATTNNEESSAE